MVWSSSQFTYTHQKTITVDGTESLVLSGNLTSKYYSTSRDYGVFDTDANDVQAIEQVFNADYAGTSITPSDGDNLLWSPTDSRDRLLSVINGATTTLDVEEEEFSDSAVVDAIAARAQVGVTVRLVLESPSSYSSEISEIENSKRHGGRLLLQHRLLRARQGGRRRLRPEHPERRGRLDERHHQLAGQQPRAGHHPDGQRRGLGDREQLRERLRERQPGLT